MHHRRRRRRRLLVYYYYDYFVQLPFLPHDAMLALYVLSSCICVCVCLSVRLSHAGIASRRLHLGSLKQCDTIAQGF